MLHRNAVRGEWPDHNGHGECGYHVLGFDHATDAFFVGLGPPCLERTNYASFRPQRM